MKKLIAICIIGTLLSLGCAHSREIDGIKYEPYGVVTEFEKSNPEIEYQLVWGNIIWGVVLFNFILPPLYVVGWSLYEPVGPAPCPVYRTTCEIPSK